jgi:ABC-type transporter Mla subunit MlaD
MDRTTGKSSFGDRVKTAIRKANKTANKAAANGDRIKTAVRKANKTANKVADHAAKAGEIAQTAGDVFGSDRLSANGTKLLEGSGKLKSANKSALQVSQGLEKASQGKNEGFREAFEGAKDLKGHFES